jgi:hypothetical protein
VLGINGTENRVKVTRVTQIPLLTPKGFFRSLQHSANAEVECTQSKRDDCRVLYPEQRSVSCPGHGKYLYTFVPFLLCHPIHPGI